MSRTWRIGVTTVAAALVLAACSSGGAGGGGEGAGQEPGAGTDTGPTETVLKPGFFGKAAQEPAGEPVDGGVLDFATFVPPDSLDPVEVIGKGCCGGIELLAIYDALMRYNPKTDEYEPHLAQSLTPSNDFQTWTLELRPNVNFTDGTPLNAAAVKFNIERYIREDGYAAEVLNRMLDQVTTPDPLTVVFELTRSWPRFPSMLADTPGYIASPTAVKKWGEDYGTHPVGAGPFMLEEFVPGEELVLTANPNYWDGRPHLDKVRFVFNLRGSEIKLDALNTGELDMAFLRKPAVNTEAIKRGYSGYTNIQNFGGGFFINHRPGRPGSRLKVRQAIAHAINPEVIDQAAYEGKGLPGKALFQEFSRWHTDTKLNRYNPEKARQLLNEAMQAGYDGNIGLVYARPGEDVALAAKAMLEKVGFTVKLNAFRTRADSIKTVAVERNFDMATYGINVPDASPYPDLFNRYVAKNNISGFQSAEFDRLLQQFVTAADYQAKLDAMADIQRFWTEHVPSVITHAMPETIAWQDYVHGVVPTRDSMVFLDEAWMSK